MARTNLDTLKGALFKGKKDLQKFQSLQIKYFINQLNISCSTDLKL